MEMAGSLHTIVGLTIVCKNSCEINWLDPEPIIGSSDYATYMEEVQRIQQGVDFYRGYHQPPNELEYRRLCEGSP